MALGWSKICCPVDFSETSWVALDQAARLAAAGAELVILHVYDRGAMHASQQVFAGDPQLEERIVQQMNGRLELSKARAEQLAPGRVWTECVGGDPAAEIVRFADRGDFDLVVMGTHGRSGVRHLLLGSVAERVVRNATCSVLVVRPEQFRIAPD